MSKKPRKNLHLNLSEEEHKLITKDYPNGFHSPSEFVREVCVAYIEERLIFADKDKIDPSNAKDQNLAILHESEIGKVLDEINNRSVEIQQQNQEILTILSQLAETIQNPIKNQRNEYVLINEFTDWIVANPDVASSFDDIDKFMMSPYVQDYQTVFLKTLLRLKDRGILTTKPSGALIWLS